MDSTSDREPRVYVHRARYEALEARLRGVTNERDEGIKTMNVLDDRIAELEAENARLCKILGGIVPATLPEAANGFLSERSGAMITLREILNDACSDCNGGSHLEALMRIESWAYGKEQACDMCQDWDGESMAGCPMCGGTRKKRGLVERVQPHRIDRSCAGSCNLWEAALREELGAKNADRS